MTAVPRTQKDLSMLLKKIAGFLERFESLYVGDEPSRITQCRLCIFQLIYIPFHITYNGSIRFGSQAICERAIGNIGHGIRSKKSPFKNIVSYKTDQQSARLLHLTYPIFSSASEAIVQKTSLFKEIPMTQKERRKDNDWKAHLEAIQSHPGVGSDATHQIKRWGKCPLFNNVTLTCQLFELSKKATSCTSRYFEAQLSQVLQPRTQFEDETELELEKTNPILGEALAFYTVAETDLSLVVYHPLIECHKQFGRWYGRWSTSLCVLKTSAIVSLIGIWTYNDHVHTVS